MWFSLFATVLVLAVVFYQGLQGLFSALINCVLTILAAAMAFGFYEDLYQMQLMAYQPDHGRATALVGIFVVSLLIMRTVVDQLIKDNLHFPIYVDRAVGGAFGFVTAMIIIGMLAIGFQMLPFDSTFLGFSRYTLADTSGSQIVNRTRESAGSKKSDDTQNLVYRSDVEWANVATTRHNLWFNPDGFTVGLISILSEYSLQGRTRFSDLNPDFLDQLHHIRDGLGRDSLAGVNKNTVRVQEYRLLPETQSLYKRVFSRNETGNQVADVKPANRKPSPGMRWMRVTVEIAEKTDNARDKENLNFTSSQVRLLARNRKDGPVIVCPLVAINENEQNEDRLLEVFPCQDIQYKRGASQTRLNLVFEVPDNSDFKPWLIQYKQNGLSELSPSMDKTDGKPGSGSSGKSAKPQPKKKPEPTDDSTTPSSPDAPSETDTSSDTGSSSATPTSPNPAGRVHGVNLAEREPFFSNDLPFKLTSYSQGMDLELSGSRLQGVKSLTARLNNDWDPPEGTDPAIERFDVPEGRHLLQVSVAQLDPQSWLGNIKESAVNQVQNIYLVDSSGRQYMPVGKYAIADVNGQVMFELTYLNEIARDSARIPPFEQIKIRNLKGRYAYVFLFIVPPGTKPAKFHTGTTDIPLDQFNLVAPR